MIAIVLISFNRLKLLKQTIESIRKNTKMDYQLIVVDNSKDEETPKYLESLKDIIYYRFPKLDDDYEYAEHIGENTPMGKNLSTSEGTVYWDHRMTVGKSYTKGAELAPDSEYIYFVQNDMYHLPGWDTLMTKALDYEDIIMVAGYSGGSSEGGRDIGDKTRLVQTVAKIPGSNMMFRRKDWDKVVAFPDYDEDNWMCGELGTRYSKTMGLIYPYIVIHCGYTSTLVGGMETKRTKTGDWSTVETMMKQYPDIIYE